MGLSGKKTNSGIQVLDPGSKIEDQDPEFLFSGEATATVGIMYLD